MRYKLISIRIAFFLAFLLGIHLSSHAQSGDVIDSLPNLGSSSVKYLSKQQAKILGAAYIRQARKAMKFVNDPILKEYINTLGNRLTQYGDKSLNTPDKFTFYLVQNPTINAFAAPGGHIVINTGLIESTENEAELASVFSHEIAHITQNHIARGFENSRYDTLISLATVLVAAASGSAEAAQAGIVAGSGALIQKQLAYTRSFEREADAAGIRTLYKAGYPVIAASDFLHKLLAADRFSGANAPEFLLSHPLTVSRISAMEQRIKSYPINSRSSNDPLNDGGSDFRDIKARVSALYGDSAQRMAKQLAETISIEQQSGIETIDTFYYQYGLSLSRSNNTKEALVQLKKAAELSPNKIVYQIAIAETVLENNKTTGLSLFKKLYQQYAAQMPSIALYYANALILANQSNAAIPVLKKMLEHSPQEPGLHIMLARAYGENNRLFQSYVARSEHHYLRGNFEFAIKQLDNAIATAPNDIEKAIFKAKRDNVKREFKETKKALRLIN